MGLLARWGVRGVRARADQLRSQRALAAELTEIQVAEDEAQASLRQREQDEQADVDAAAGLATFARNLLGKLGRITDRPAMTIEIPTPIVNVTTPAATIDLPAPVVHVEAPPPADVHVYVPPPEPRPNTVRATKEEDGTTVFEVVVEGCEE